MEEEKEVRISVFRTKSLCLPVVKRNVCTVFCINAYAFCIWMYVFLQHIIVSLCGKLPNILNRSISCPCSLGSDNRVLRSKVCGSFVSMDFCIFITETSC